MNLAHIKWKLRDLRFSLIIRTIIYKHKIKGILLDIGLFITAVLLKANLLIGNKLNNAVMFFALKKRRWELGL